MNPFRRSSLIPLAFVFGWSACAVAIGPVAAQGGEIHGQVFDAVTKRPIAARIYVRSDDGRWLFARSATPRGTAIPYDKKPSERSFERHTTVSADPFLIDAAPGGYEITAVRGPEYRETAVRVQVREGSPARVEIEMKLERWIDMNALGWFSGDTHAHRGVDEMANLLPAEDLNVALPLTQWVTKSNTPPARGDKTSTLPARSVAVPVEENRVYYPLNTEYELFSVNDKRHTLGAVFVLNHQKPLTLGAPPVKPIADEARRQGAILDLDKHTWPWSLMVVPVMNVDLFELANNHVWRTEFLFKTWTAENKPSYFPMETDKDGYSERAWIDWGFETYYAMLNCGFRMRPTAGTGSGVHPVPLGFGRVYVHLESPFRYDRWIEGLNAGRSFVTTRPMLDVRFNGQRSGSKMDSAARSCRIQGWAESPVELDRIEVLVNGEVAAKVAPRNEPTPTRSYRSAIDATVPIDGTSWAAVRCFEKAGSDGKFRFAHSAPIWFDVPSRPLYPRRDQTAHLIQRMEEEIKRNQGVLDEASLNEYRQALAVYRELAKHAR